jgi:hypothetical protein
MRNAYNILGGKPQGKRTLGRSRSRWEDNIKIYLREIGKLDVDLKNRAENKDRSWGVVNMVEGICYMQLVFS